MIGINATKARQAVVWLLIAGFTILVRLSHSFKWFVLLIDIAALIAVALHLADIRVVIRLGA
jgi:hypothetical protein